MGRVGTTALLGLVMACAASTIDDSGTLLEPRAVDAERLHDGIFRGNVKRGPNRAIVEIEVTSGRIRTVRVVQHKAWKGVVAQDPIVRQIVERQSTDVDVVSGATNSSRVLMQAAQAAVERSYGDGK